MQPGWFSSTPTSLSWRLNGFPIYFHNQSWSSKPTQSDNGLNCSHYLLKNPTKEMRKDRKSNSRNNNIQNHLQPVLKASQIPYMIPIIETNIMGKNPEFETKLNHNNWPGLQDQYPIIPISKKLINFPFITLTSVFYALFPVLRHVSYLRQIHNDILRISQRTLTRNKWSFKRRIQRAIKGIAAFSKDANQSDASTIDRRINTSNPSKDIELL